VKSGAYERKPFACTGDPGETGRLVQQLPCPPIVHCIPEAAVLAGGVYMGRRPLLCLHRPDVTRTQYTAREGIHNAR